jgi:hypothetical protein
MYSLLTKWFPKPVAIMLIVIWYLLLLFLVFMYIRQPAGEFRYLNR